jgi:hypothetical protein
MLQPFPPDKMSQQRQDFCMAPENISARTEALECVLSARQCGSFVASTRDPRLANSASGPLLSSLEAFDVHGWRGTQWAQMLEADGGCAVLSVDPERYRRPLWDAFGEKTVKQAMGGVMDAVMGEPVRPPVPMERYEMEEPAFGSPKFILEKFLRQTQGFPYDLARP